MRFFSAASALVFLAVALAGCTGADGSPSAAFTATAQDAEKSTFSFDASGSKGASSYTWDFGDGTTAQGETAQHTYQYINGDYHVKLTIKNSKGLSAALDQVVTTGNQANNAPAACMAADTRLAAPDQEVVFDASTSHDADDEPLTYRWDFNYPNPDEARDTFANMGHVQYGHIPECAGGNAIEGSGEHMHSAQGAPDPSDVTRPVLDLLPTRDGGHDGGVHETFNTEFNGSVESSDAIQVFKFPSPATYYVVVKVSDPKGETATGFLRIMVDADAPAKIQSDSHKVTLQYGSDTLPPISGAPANKTDSWAWKMSYPGAASVTITFKTDTANPAGDPELQGWICVATADDAQCKSTPTASIPKGKSPLSATHGFTAAFPGQSYRLLVENMSTSVNVQVTESLTRQYDTNPWYAEESGVGGGHSGH